MKMSLAPIFLILFLFPLSASGTLFLNLIDYANGNARLDRTMGTRFQVGGQDLLVTDLGFLDLGFPSRADAIGSNRTIDDTTPPDGLLSTHRAGLWSESGDLLAEVTFPIGITSEVEQQWRFESLHEPILIRSGEIYTVGVKVGGIGDPIMLNGGTPRSFKESPELRPLADVHFDGSFAFPNIETYSGSLVAPINGTANFRYTVVPECSVAFYPLAGLVFLFGRNRKR